MSVKKANWQQPARRHWRSQGGAPRTGYWLCPDPTERAHNNIWLCHGVASLTDWLPSQRSTTANEQSRVYVRVGVHPSFPFARSVRGVCCYGLGSRSILLHDRWLPQHGAQQQMRVEPHFRASHQTVHIFSGWLNLLWHNRQMCGLWI